MKPKHDIKLYKKKKFIGKGQYGSVYLCSFAGREKDYVMKTISLTSQSPEEREIAREEATILSKLESPFVIKLQTAFVSDSVMIIITDFADAGSLEDLIERNRKERTRESCKTYLNYICQALIGLQYLHGCHVIHRDIKPANLLLFKTGRLKIADFGISKVMEVGKVAQTMVGTPLYLPPEKVLNKAYDFKSDIWSLGILMYELYTGKIPYKSVHIVSLFRDIVKKEPPMIKDPRVPNSHVILASSMLVKDPKKRPTATALLRTPTCRRALNHLLASLPPPRSSC